MHVMILGGAGMVGRKLAERIAAEGGLGGKPVEHLSLIDVIAPATPHGFIGTTDCTAADLSVPGTAAEVLTTRPDIIFHLAAIVSGEAEMDLEKGYRVNLDGMRFLLDAIRAEQAANGPWKPRVVFSSSIAVFGGDMPDVIDDAYFLTPGTSYGTQKAMCELLLADYARRGFIDGIGLRLPTVCVRPGKPNLAASGFFSNIIREPLVGLPAVLPVSDKVQHWMASPRATIGFLVHAAGLDTALLRGRTSLSMPGLSVTVAEQIAGLEKVAGPKAVALIKREPDDRIIRIVDTWARGFDTSRAAALGFVAETAFEQIVRVHVEDELGGKIPVLG
ncbi:SDR family oxidoreductase [Acidisoma cellulosilytica]|uniref:SDR family oxidoreductase n=1 Tax=Acidisoma cellulosilyticum TaxID=2802395 RepID=A0A963Z0S4_9PROT|nr:D-erythronate dehydrogenase [Acidisoma cellulosilyticum]MCB8880600.1 SDR family oxidoreductase [Acidisoma cellulosilyticum]